MRDSFHAPVSAFSQGHRLHPKSARGLGQLLLLVALMGIGQAQATISSGISNPTGPNATFYKGNGELVFVASDPVNQVSYTLDLGLDMNAFFISAQQETFTQLFIPIADAQWAAFLPQINAGDLRWTVFASQASGSTQAGLNRIFTTVQQGDEANIASLTNQKLSWGNSSATVKVFIDAVNVTGTHGGSTNLPLNGSSVNVKADKPAAYFGSNSAPWNDTMNGNAPFSMSNKLGDSSWFYYLTRSGIDQLGTILVDEFDNMGHDGYWGFTKVADDANSPYKGQYLLSYTLEASGPRATTAAGQMRMNLTDYTAGFAAKAFSSTQIEFAGYRPGSLVLVGMATPLAAVPEPASWGLMGLGLLALAGRARRRAAQA
ncbi:hypothetical protein HNP55_004641 [Paucibacter oligotrophus]|uniref:Ice-binding protein C-terminal domain-containing protein n=1 Tax=Roseateles oligotrophus TaxID=1769250 RepID=A0A840LLA7_9BURK|nr:PEP-CTERM sorting domain-containing protein [Roseateles oligotrophus]MBB4846087.1 hypothetical protein [Roseateles oligotrophus]